MVFVIYINLQNNKELADQLQLRPADFYKYINQSGCVTIDGISDAKKFDGLRLAFNILQISPEMCEGLYKVLAAILWLGNLQFEVRLVKYSYFD